MTDLEKKEKVNRYPMKTHKQAKTTLSRLTRDLLHGRIDVQTYRAACYGLSVLCSLFKFESPELQHVNVDVKAKNVFNSPEESEAQILELETQMRNLMSATERREKAAFWLEGLETTSKLISVSNLQQAKVIDEPSEWEIEEEPTSELAQFPAQWKRSGIGAKR